MKKRLTEQGVAKLKPSTTGSIDIYDAVMPGLVLRVGYGGKKSWRVLYYVPTVAKSGKKVGQRISMPTTHTIGRFPVLSVKQAREKARAFLANPQRALAQAGCDLAIVEDERARAVTKYAEFAAQGIAPQAFLYRHFEHTGDLIYVGITADIPQRLVDHSRRSGWSSQICFTVIEPFASREQALAAEHDAIRTEWPRYNTIHNGYRHPVADLHRVARRARRAARRAAEISPNHPHGTQANSAGA